MMRLVEDSNIEVFTEDALMAIQNLLSDDEETMLAFLRDVEGGIEKLVTVLNDPARSGLSKTYALACLLFWQARKTRPS